MRRLAVLLASLTLLAACSADGRRRSSGYHLVEKGAYQALYRPDGRLERVVYDQDGDRRADAVVLYQPNGKPGRAEIDTNQDGRIDRREYFDGAGRLMRVEP